MPTFKTAFGLVNEVGLDDLRDSFDTTSILRAIDAVDQACQQLEEMRENLLTLHGVTMDTINDAPSPIRSGSVDVYELVEEADSAAFDVSDAMDAVLQITRDLEKLGSGDVWDALNL